MMMTSKNFNKVAINTILGDIAFAKVAYKRRLFPRYTALCYFVDKEEWADEFDE